LEIKSDATFDDDSFDSKGEKIKEAKLLIDPLDLPCDILSEYDSFNSQDFSKDDVLFSHNNEDKVFNPGILSEWLKFNNCEFSADSQKEFRKRHLEILIKEIERPKALDIDEFGALHEGVALQNLHQFCHVSYREEDRTFPSQAWNMLFRTHERVVREHNGKKKVTLDDLFLLHSMDGGVRVDVPWHVAKFFTNKSKRYIKKSLIIGAHLIGRIARLYRLMTQGSLRNVTLGSEIFLLNVAKLVDLGIYRYNGLGYGDIPNNGKDEGAADVGDDSAGGVRHRPNMSFTNRLRAMDE
nr:hypothetical protein [Tanacetum cinerariifolium]